ncbi:hypothetical protein DFH28DRAFT_877576 [Melampsora americana]|nr:hypothetical protein DFH28DRAFT_877576 [Melampsora americana]
MPKKTSAKVPKQAWLAFGCGGGKGGGGKGGGGKGGGGKGRGGKGGGKKAGSKSVVHDLPVSIPVNPHESSSPQKESNIGKGGKGKSKPKAKDEHPIILKERRKIVCVAPPGADIGTETRKPPYTYASLIAQALTAQADEDGKMLVNEMCEWIAGVYPFYGVKPKGTDWQSAVRHNLNADKRFKRIERQPTDGGKGNFWTLKEEERVNFDGLELRRPKPEPIPKPVKVQPTNTTAVQSMTIEHKPSASIANLVRGGITTHRRSGIGTSSVQSNSVNHEERHSILVPSYTCFSSS